MTGFNSDSMTGFNMVSLLREHHHSAKCQNQSHTARTESSQLDMPTQRNKGFKYTQKQKTENVKHEAQYMSIMSLEIHVNTRDGFVPDPEKDAIQCIFWCFNNEDTSSLGIVCSEDGLNISVTADIQEMPSEIDLLIRIAEIVRQHDPDILAGYEVNNSSWGYVVDRAWLRYDYDIRNEFSRIKSEPRVRGFSSNIETSQWESNTTSKIQITGRHVINIWRAMQSELHLLQYTMENVVFRLLHRRIPHYSWKDLTIWYSTGDMTKVFDYYLSRVKLDLDILKENELVYRTSEQARLLGVDFFSVFLRGSQFKVESLMFRIAKPENFLLISPSKKQVGEQNALYCLPLVMEPQSDFYASPVLVFDFQSLYPSIMIAYNYCYSTFLGRVVDRHAKNRMGFADYKRKQGLLELLEDQINVSPNGMMFVKPEIRKSLLAKMLGEILETRLMVKSGMKFDPDDRTLQMLLNNRQLALKLIANVTYGYTSASFSGRMPCTEIADSIVQAGRETLEKAIALIHSRWDAEVVYGDTDSIFVYLKGRTREQAFKIGKEISDAVTKMNPRPIKLKFEKVYHPCVLLTKKRYVGFKYETVDQEPEFDAKGIETVRRDGTPAEQKIEENALKILFRTSDVSQVKSFFQDQCKKIMQGSVSILDFCFAREIKTGSLQSLGNSRNRTLTGSLIAKRTLKDPRSEPQYGERVPYVVITGPPGSKLSDRCVSPTPFVELDTEYYITKNIIPPLERIFSLIGVNVRSWYDEMPKIQRLRKIEPKTLEFYMLAPCPVCKETKTKTTNNKLVCDKCLENQSGSLLTLQSKLNTIEKKIQDLEITCRSCSNLTPNEEIKCDSKDCPIFYSRVREKAILKSEGFNMAPAIRMLSKLQW
jgi:DNA polymerase zeta